MTAHIYALFLIILLFADVAAAQDVSLVPIDPKRWDSTVTIGWFGGNKDAIAGDWNNWYETFATSVDVGRYWTPHLKTEAAAMLTGDGRVYSYLQPHERQFRLRALNLSAVYQALENSWVHPFVAVGVQLGWERQRTQIWVPRRPGDPPLIPTEITRTTVDAQPFLAGGTKFYATEVAFIRTDLSAAFDGRGATRVSWRIGGGIDF